MPIIVVSASSSAEIMHEAITYGAAGFIPQVLPQGRDRRRRAAVINSEIFLPSDIAGGAAEQANGHSPLRERMATLTQGELRVLALLAQGKSNKIIAYELGIRESTVKAHITGILRKLRVHSRTQAVIAARELHGD
ncbi:MAG: response regulator transcription factor [Rhodospirillales bacterium]